MEFLNKILALLNKPFPVEESNSAMFKIIVAISIFVTLFLFIFQPFGIAEVPSGKFWVCLGFGISTFVGSYIYEFIVTFIFKLKGKRERFVFWKWVIYVIGVILCISIVNFLYARIFFFGYIQWDLLPAMIAGTFKIGIFPTILLGALALMQQERKYQNIASEINQKKVSASDEVNSNASVSFRNPSKPDQVCRSIAKLCENRVRQFRRPIDRANRKSYFKKYFR